MARKKITTRARPKTGLAGAPRDNFFSLKHYFNYEIDKKTYSKIIKEYAKSRYNKDELACMNANPEWKFATYSHVAASCYWDTLGEEFPESYPAKEKLFPKYFAELIESGKKILEEKVEEAENDATPAPRRLTPQELLARKVNETVLPDIDGLIESWIEGDLSQSIDLYELFQKYDLKGAAVEQVRRFINTYSEEMSDALDKKCEQATEAYAHLTKKELRRRIKMIADMNLDLDRVKDAAKAKRTVRKAKPKPIDKQVARVKYKKEDNDLKLVSINPTKIIGANRLLVLNAKYKTITEYITTAVNGFEVSGTTIKNFDPDKSRSKKLRKVEEFLPFVKKSVKQFDKAFTALTTKESNPNGRLNDETILLRAD